MSLLDSVKLQIARKKALRKSTRAQLASLLMSCVGESGRLQLEVNTLKGTLENIQTRSAVEPEYAKQYQEQFDVVQEQFDTEQAKLEKTKSQIDTLRILQMSISDDAAATETAMVRILTAVDTPTMSDATFRHDFIASVFRCDPGK